MGCENMALENFSVNIRCGAQIPEGALHCGSWGSPDFLLSKDGASACAAHKIQMHASPARKTPGLYLLADGTNSGPSQQIALECLRCPGHYASKMLKRVLVSHLHVLCES